MKQPTYIAGESPFAGINSPASITPISTEGLSSGISQYTNTAAAILEKSRQRQESLWVKEQALKANRDTTEWLIGASNNPKQSAIGDWDNYWNEYSKELVKGAPSEQAAETLSLSLGNLEVNTVPKVFSIKATADRTFAIDHLTSMRQSANDMISFSPSMETLLGVKQELSTAISDMEGFLDKETTAKLTDSLVELNLEAAKLWAIDDPTLARQAIAEAKGIPADVRAAALKDIANAESSMNSANRVLFEREKEDYISFLRSNGSGQFDVDGYIQSFPAADQVGKRTALKKEEANARAYYKFSKEIVGKSSNEVDAILSTYVPTKQEGHESDMQLYKELSSAADNYKKMLSDDGFVASLQSPAVKQLFENADTEDPANLQDVIAVSSRVQTDMGIPQGNIKVAPSEQLTQIAAQLNKGSVVEVVNGINQLKSLYGQYYPDLFRNLLELPSDAKVSTNLSMIHEHINGEQTPSWVYNFIDATRKTYSDFGYTERDAKDFEDSVNRGSFRDLQKALYGELGANSFDASKELVGAMTKYAMFLDASGETSGTRASSKKAVSQIIDSVTYFGEAQGKTYRIPKRTPDGEISEATAKKIRYTLTQTLDPDTQNKYAAIFGGPSKVPTPFHINMVGEEQFGFPPDASGEFKVKVIEQAIRTHGYWATTPDDSGVILMSKASDTSRNSPVLNNKGEPIYVSFKDAAAWADAISNYRYDQLNAPPKKPVLPRSTYGF